MEDRRIFFLIHRAQRRLQKISNKLFIESLGVSSAQMAAIFFLLKNDGCLLKELSEGLDLNNSAITGLVNRMDKAGLIKKEKCAEDGRAFRIFLTNKSKDLAPKAFPLMQESNKIITKNFSEEEVNIVIRFLNEIVRLEVVKQ